MKHTFFKLPGLWLYADHLGDYMQRWIIQHPWGHIRLHHILKSDEGRDLHDHPFDFISFLLIGWYIEHLPGGDQRFVNCVNVHKAEDLHRLELDIPVWTLVFTGPRRRSWGFKTASGWVPWREYARAGVAWHEERKDG